MTPETPVLMIALQIPLNAEITADQVLEAIGQQVREALEQIRSKQETDEGTEMTESAPERIELTAEQKQFKESLIKETLETYSDNTRDDLLAGLGYAPPSG